MKTFLLVLFTLTQASFGQSSDSLDSAFSQTKKLTDQQANEAQTFVHQGVKDAAIKKGCEKLDGCDVSKVDSKGVILPGMLENNIGKLYTVLFGGMGFLSGNGPKVTVKGPGSSAVTETPAPGTPAPTPAAGAAPATPGHPANSTHQSSDYCIYPAMGYEMLSMAMQTAMQNNAQKESANLNDPQLQALVNLKETHKARQKTATIQSTVYGATSACYIARAAFGGVQMDPKYIAKMAASGAISVLFMAKAKKHGDAAKKVQAVIDSLPKAGDCNPWTGTSCFCAQKTSQTLYPSQYQEVCVLNAGNFDGTVANVGCGVQVNGAVQLDAACKCKATNSCLRTTLSGYNPNFNFGKNFMDLANKGFDLASNGTVDTAKLGSYSTSEAALAAKILPKVNTSNIPDVNLSDDQKKSADSLANFMPAKLAALTAASAVGSPNAGGLMNGGAKAALQNLPTSMKKRFEDAEVNGKYSSRGGSNSSGAVEDPSIGLPKLPGQEQASSGTEIMTFAERAVNNADVSNAPDTAIFDIISNRYRRSAWERFKPE